MWQPSTLLETYCLASRSRARLKLLKPNNACNEEIGHDIRECSLSTSQAFLLEQNMPAYAIYLDIFNIESGDNPILSTFYLARVFIVTSSRSFSPLLWLIESTKFSEISPSLCVYGAARNLFPFKMRLRINLTFVSC